MVIFLLFMIFAVLVFILRAMTSTPNGKSKKKTTWAEASKQKGFNTFATIYISIILLGGAIGTWLLILWIG